MSRILGSLIMVGAALSISLALSACSSGSHAPVPDNGGTGDVVQPSDPGAGDVVQPSDPGAGEVDKPADQNTSDEDPPSYDFTVNVRDASFRYGGSIESVEVSSFFINGEDLEKLPWNGSGQVMMGFYGPINYVQLDIKAVGAENLKEFYCDINFDGSIMCPVIGWPSQLLFDAGDLGEGWWLSSPGPFSLVNGEQNHIIYGQALMKMDELPGFSGDGDIVRYWFELTGWAPDAIFGDPIVAPQLEDCRVTLAYSEAEGLLKWGYNLPGDFNQDGLVDLYDSSEIARLFEDQVTGLDSIAGVLMGTADGIVDCSGFTSIGKHHHNAVDSFQVYSGALADYPAGGQLLGTVPFSAAIGDPMIERLYFEFALTPAAGTSYWVKPAYAGETGIPSAAYTF